MKKVSVKDVKPGMELARPVYGVEGQVILNEGVKLKPQYIRNLVQMDVSSVYVKDERLEDVEQEDVIAEKTKLETRNLLKNVFKETAQGKESLKNVVKLEKKITQTIDNIIEDILENKELVLNLVEIKSTNNYHFDHSLSVAVLSIITAIKMELPLSLIKRNTPGLLLFDIGNIKIPNFILNKPGPLTNDELEIVKKHPVHGYRIFKKTNLFSDNTADIILQHHERLDGNGYPRGLKEDDINLFAQIVAVADVYDALISHRPYRQAYSPDKALQILSTMSNEGLNARLIQEFYKFVAAYPVGTHVMLSNEQSGLVIGNTAGYPFRPKVRVFYEGEQLTPISNPYEIDLTERLDVVVKRVINEEETEDSSCMSNSL